MRQVIHNNGFVTVIGIVALASGFLLGSRIAPQPLNSELADAQVVAQDRQVRYVGYVCGDDGATVISREMPNITECQEILLLSDVAEFPIPPRV